MAPKQALSAEEDAKHVMLVRSKLPDADVSDSVISRFLLTRSYDVDGTCRMLERHLKWRAETFPVNFEEVQSVFEERKLVRLPAAADGRPVFMIGMKQLNEVDWNKEGEIDRHLRAVVYLVEEMIADMPPDVHTWNAVVNCHGICAPPYSFMSKFSAMMQANYPERANHVVLFPIPAIIVSMVKGMLSAVKDQTREKICFVNSLDTLCKESGLALSNLPADLLGVDVDPELLKQAIKIDVPAGTTAVHRVPCKADQNTTWQFFVEDNHKIAFELGFVSGGGQADGPVSSGQKFNVAAVPAGAKKEKGEYTAEKEGCLAFSFDNSSSFFTGKRVVLIAV